MTNCNEMCHSVESPTMFLPLDLGLDHSTRRLSPLFPIPSFHHGYRQATRRGRSTFIRMTVRSPCEIIASKPKARRGRGGTSARGRGGSARARYASTVPKATAPAAAVKPVASEATKIIISNLPNDVTEAAVRVSRPSLQSSSTGFNAIHHRTRQVGADDLYCCWKEHGLGDRFVPK